jgi:hypothetical protein
MRLFLMKSVEQFMVSSSTKSIFIDKKVLNWSFEIWWGGNGSDVRELTEGLSREGSSLPWFEAEIQRKFHLNV